MAARFCAAVAAFAAILSSPAVGEAASCRGYGQEIQAAIKRHVEALRLVEREAVDRVAGLDTRPYEYLLGQARAAVLVIDDKDGLAAEDALSRCRNYVAPARRTCATAAQALVRLIEEQVAGAASKPTKQVYGRSMPQCERWMGLVPLQTAFRIAD